MPSTFTTNKQFEKQATGENENTWGVQLNALFDDIDLALGYGAKSVAGSSDTSLTADEAKPLALEFTGALTGNKSVIFPTTAALYVVYNNTSGAFTLTAKTASGTGVLLPQGGRCFVYCDATNITTAQTALTTSFELAGVVAPSQITANQNDYAPTGHATANVLRINSDAARDITGLAGGRLGRVVLIANVGSFAITLKDESGSSTAANRFALTADLILGVDQVAMIWYDITTARWRAASSGVDTGTATTWTASLTAGAAFSLSGDVSPSQITSNQNDYNPTNLSTASTLRLTTDASRNITGLQGGTDGRIMVLSNVGSFPIVLVDESSSSTAAYRFALPEGNLTLIPDAAAMFQYDSTSSRWRPLIPFNVQHIDPPQCRLTLASGTPVVTSDQTAKTAVYWTPYIGNLTPVYNGVAFVNVPSAELTLTLNSPNHAADTNYDVFEFEDPGTPGSFIIGTGPAWSSATARGTGAGTTELARVSGILVNNVSMTARNGASTYTVAANRGTYLGTIRTTGSAGQTEFSFGSTGANGSAAKLYVWNYYNRVDVRGLIADSTDSWTYTTATVRPANNSTTMRVSWICGFIEDFFTAQYQVPVQSSGTVQATAGIGYDATNAFSGRTGYTIVGSSGPSLSIGDHRVNALGHHFMNACEWSVAAGTTTWLGDNAGTGLAQSGLSYDWRA